jgi:WD40 repeat protein/tRNA A-37 threonylcarbamoyl transferase component Bud32
MAVDSVASLLDQLQENGLLSPAQLNELRGGPYEPNGNPQALAKQLVQRGWLTRFQAKHLLQGRGGDLILGPYRLLDAIGQGGMGQVFKAQHTLMNRIVALKVIRKEKLSKPGAVARFHREVQLAAQLAHPNIVTAYDAGRTGDNHYFAMEYVDGSNLFHLIRQNGPLPVAQACECIRQAALGLQHAHERGLIHRDVKPSNLLVTRTAEGALLVKILDMGLARLQNADDADTALTRDEQIMGTPDYLAPEQAMNSRGVDIRADLYSLGCTLYYLLTGRVPFPGKALTEVLLRHQMEGAVPVEHLRPEVPTGVGIVVRRLMAKKPEERYQQPREVAEALEPFCRDAGGAGEATWARAEDTGEPPQRETPSSATLITRRERRPEPRPPEADPVRRLMLWGGLIAAAFLVVLVVVGLVGRSPKPRPEPRVARAPAEPEDIRAPGAVEPAPVKPLPLPVPPGLPPEAKGVPVPVPAPPAPLPIRDGPGEIGKFEGLTAWAQCVAFSPDRRFALSGSVDRNVILWDVTTGREVRRFTGHTHAVFGVAFSPDGRTAASCGADRTVRLWDVATGNQLHCCEGHREQVNAVAFSRDGQRVLSGSDDQTVRVWDAAGGKELRRLDGHAGAVACVAFLADGRTALSGSADRTVRRWDIETAKEVRRYEGQGSAVLSLAASPDGRRLLASGSGGGLRLYDVDSGLELGRWQGHAGPASSVAFGPDGRRALSGGGDNAVILWDTATGGALYRFLGHTRPVKSVALSSDGRLALSSALDQTIRLWALPKGELPPVPERPIAPVAAAPDLHRAPLTGVAFAPDGRRVATASQDGDIRLWDLETQKLLRRFEGATGVVRALAFGANGHRLAAAGADGTARVWDADTGRLADSLPGLKRMIEAVAFVPDGRFVALGGTDNTAHVWQAENVGTPRHYGMGAAVTALAVPADGNSLSIGLEDGTIRRIYVMTSKDAGRFERHAGAVTGLAHSPDGNLLLSGGVDRTLRLWNVATRRAVQIFKGLTGKVTAVAYAPNGRYVLAGDEKTLRLWDVRSPVLLLRSFEGHTANVLGVAFSPDGRHILSAAADGTVRVWDAENGREVRRLEVQR